MAMFRRPSSMDLIVSLRALYEFSLMKYIHRERSSSLHREIWESERLFRHKRELAVGGGDHLESEGLLRLHFLR